MTLTRGDHRPPPTTLKGFYVVGRPYAAWGVPATLVVKDDDLATTVAAMTPMPPGGA